MAAIQRRGAAGQEVDYGYDHDGNVTSIVGPGVNQHFQFDSANQLACVGPSATQCTTRTFHYDVDGRRLLDVEANGESTHHVNAWYTAKRYNGGMQRAYVEVSAFGESVGFKYTDGSLRTTSVGWWPATPVDPAVGGWLAALGGLGLLGLAGRRGALVLVLERPGTATLSLLVTTSLVFPPVAWGQGGGGTSLPVYRWEISDHLGTSSVLVDETGDRVRHTLFTPFGKKYGWYGEHCRRKRFAGHEIHHDTGLVYMQARWMDPNAGTFLSIDPLVGDAFDPQSVNAYSYARNNPVSYTDPTGMAGVYIGISGTGGAGGGATLMRAVGIDTKGNIDLITTFGGGGYGGAGGAISVTLGVHSAPTTADLSGPGAQVGGSVGEGISVGAEAVTSNNEGRNDPMGVEVNVGLGGGLAPAELHGMATSSKISPITSVEGIIDVFDDAVEDLLDALIPTESNFSASQDGSKGTQGGGGISSTPTLSNPGYSLIPVTVVGPPVPQGKTMEITCVGWDC